MCNEGQYEQPRLHMDPPHRYTCVLLGNQGGAALIAVDWEGMLPSNLGNNKLQFY